MATGSTRRNFLKLASFAGSAGCILHHLPDVTYADATLPPDAVCLRPEIEPLVRMIEVTPRDELLEIVGAKIRAGISYQQLLASLMLAGVRNVQPRPNVGFKFHAVLVVNAAHLASLASPNEHRWLPIFWALDNFKSSQERDVQENDWTMNRVDESTIPTASKCRTSFIFAMDNWDESAADAAVTGVARHLPANSIYELFFRYGARDFRSIGHKAIFVANSWRTLQCIGWRHAEPIVRSLAYALLNHDGTNPAKSDAEADRPWRENVARARQFRSDWLDGCRDDTATTHILSTLRTGSYRDVCELVLKQVNAGIAPQSIWDAFFLNAAELLVRQPGILALHAMTSTNALCFAFRTTANDDTRRMLLLQTAAFIALFRKAMEGSGKLNKFQINGLQPWETSKSNELAPEIIFSDVSQDKMRAAQRVLAYLKDKQSPECLLDQARLLMFFKGKGAHDYKFGSAVLEDYYQISPTWRDRYLAAAVFKLRGSRDQDNPLVTRTQRALG